MLSRQLLLCLHDWDCVDLSEDASIGFLRCGVDGSGRIDAKIESLCQTLDVKVSGNDYRRMVV